MLVIWLPSNGAQLKVFSESLEVTFFGERQWGVTGSVWYPPKISLPVPVPSYRFVFQKKIIRY